MRLPVLLVSCGIAAAFVPPSGAASATTVKADEASRTAECGGGDAIVEGSRNALTFTGNCRGLAVRGDGNDIAIEMSPGARLDIQGNANRIRYSLGGPPMLRIVGGGTRIDRVEGAPPPASAMTLTGDGLAIDLDCAGRDVVIHGNRSQYVLRGGCRSVAANGTGNRIQAELVPGARGRLEGNDSIFAYAVLGGGDADIAVRGVRSRAERADVSLSGAVAAPPDSPPAPLTAAAADVAPPPVLAPPFARPPGDVADAAPVTVPMPPDIPPKPRPLPMFPATPADAAPPPAEPVVAIPAPAQEPAERPTAADTESPAIAAGTPRLPALLRVLGARVVAEGTRVAIPADEVFQPRSDALRHAGDARLRLLVQLAGLIRPSATRLAVADPADAELATRRARALGAWLIANGVPVRQADVTSGAVNGEVQVLLAR